jgi:hypothetical protein
MYLGDGSIDRTQRTWRLRISLDSRWPGIARECVDAMKAVFNENSVLLYRPDTQSRCVVAVVYSNHVVCLFPQHGPGPKHRRMIGLVSWQKQLVREEPRKFLRGLLHSDGCRFTNRVRAGGKIYAYPRYNFTNASSEIRGLFTATCDQLGIEWRQMNSRNISIARRDAVVLLDRFVGPKQ